MSKELQDYIDEISKEQAQQLKEIDKQLKEIDQLLAEADQREVEYFRNLQTATGWTTEHTMDMMNIPQERREAMRMML